MKYDNIHRLQIIPIFYEKKTAIFSKTKKIIRWIHRVSVEKKN